MSKKLVIGVSVLGALLLASVIFLVVSGRLVLTDPNVQRSVSKIVCDSGTVDTYNAAMLLDKRGGSDEYTFDEAGLKSLQTSIRAKDGYKDDPTCQTMLFWIAVKDEDYEAGKVAYQNVKRLYDQRIFADSNLRTDQPLFSYEAALWNISPEAAQDQEGIGDGS